MRMEVSGVFSSCETLLTKSVFCRASASCLFKSATISQLPIPNRQHEHRNQQPQRQLQRPGRLRELRRVQRINRYFPVRQGFADFRGHERTFPRRVKIRVRRALAGGVVEQGEANFLAQGGLQLLHKVRKPSTRRARQLSAKDQTRVARGRHQNRTLSLLSTKTRQRAFGLFANKLPEFRLGRCHLGELLLLRFLLLDRFLKIIGRLQRNDAPRLLTLVPERTLVELDIIGIGRREVRDCAGVLARASALRLCSGSSKPLRFRGWPGTVRCPRRTAAPRAGHRARTKEISRQRHHKPDLRQRPIFAQDVIERSGQLLRVAVSQKSGYLEGEVTLILGQGVLHPVGHGIRHTLIKQRLLALQEKLLVAQRTHRQPGQNQARRKNGQDKKPARLASFNS